MKFLGGVQLCSNFHPILVRRFFSVVPPTSSCWVHQSWILDFIQEIAWTHKACFQHSHHLRNYGNFSQQQKTYQTTAWSQHLTDTRCIRGKTSRWIQLCAWPVWCAVCLEAALRMPMNCEQEMSWVPECRVGSLWARARRREPPGPENWSSELNPKIMKNHEKSEFLVLPS